MSDAAAMLDRALLGAAFTVDHRIECIRASVRLRVLSPRELSEAGVTRDVVRNRSASQVVSELEQRASVLVRSCQLIDGGQAFGSPEDLRKLPGPDVDALWIAYARAHARTYDLGPEILSAMEERESEPGHAVDRIRARHASNLCAYFGIRSALDATPAQVFWFDSLTREER